MTEAEVKTIEQWRAENAELQARLTEAEDTLRAIRSGETDAILVGDRVFSLRGAESNYRAMIEHMRGGAVMLASDGSILYANSGLADLFQMPLENLVGTRLADLLWPGDTPPPHLADEMLKEQTTLDLLATRPDGSPLPLRVTSNPLPPETGAVAGLIIADLSAHRERERLEQTSAELQQRVAEHTAELSRSIQDLEAARIAALNMMEDAQLARLAAESALAALRESEERLRLAGEVARIGTWERQLPTNRLIWSPLMEQMMGYETGTFPGTDEAFCELLHPDSRAQHAAAQRRARQGDGVFQAELKFRLRDGRERWGLVVGRRFCDANGQPIRIIGVDVDITARKHLEQERQAMEAQLRQQQKLESIGTLASGVAHEINNPITGIMNYAQLIQDRLPGDSPLTEFTGEIMHETQRVATIVRNLLTFARNEKQSHSPARIADIIEGTLSLIRTIIRHDDITLTVNVPEDLPQLKCRSQQIQQVIMNLMTNARDALNERYPGHDPDKVLELNVQLFEKEGRRWIRATVEDHGMGITPEVRERMFDPFFTTKPRDKGTGLGLAISHGIVKEHQGEITVESEPGRFTRFHVDLPVDNGWRH